MIGIMIDVESLSLATDAALIQFAALPFDEDTFSPCGDLPWLDLRITPSPKATVDYETVDWFVRQANLEGVMGEPASRLAERDACLRIREYWWDMNERLNQERINVWSQGMTFDFPALNSLYRRQEQRVPWKFYEEADTRTLQKYLGVDSDDRAMAMKSLTGNPHEAMFDCYLSLLLIANKLDAQRESSGHA